MFFTFLVTKNQMCLTGSITSENKGGGGSDPLRKNSITKRLFFLLDGFPKERDLDNFYRLVMLVKMMPHIQLVAFNMCVYN